MNNKIFKKSSKHFDKKHFVIISSINKYSKIIIEMKKLNKDSKDYKQ